MVQIARGFGRSFGHDGHQEIGYNVAKVSEVAYPFTNINTHGTLFLLVY